MSLRYGFCWHSSVIIIEIMKKDDLVLKVKMLLVHSYKENIFCYINKHFID